MHYPEIYEDVNLNNDDRNDVRNEILSKFLPIMKWRTDKTDSLLDIGCGPGNLTHDMLIPVLPPTFSKIIGADISEEMIAYANKKYIHPKLSYRIIDAGATNMEKYFANNEKFDHITSFFATQWVQDQKRCLKNVYNLLTEKGDCLLVPLASLTIYDAYGELIKKEKWAKYMQDYKTIISPYHYLSAEEKRNMFVEAVKYAGFKDYDVEVCENRSFVYKGYEEIKKILKSCNAFVNRLPENEQDEYIEDQIKIQYPDIDPKKTPDAIYDLKYTMIIGYASK